MSEWISVEDRLPEDNKDVLVCHMYGSTVAPDHGVAWYHSGNKRWEAGTEMIEASNYDGGATIMMDCDVTHWQPLPEPPQ